MNRSINQTHDPNLRSWVESANDKDTDFPIQNLPFGVFRHRDQTKTPHIGVAIGDHILDLFACQQLGLLSELAESLQAACIQPNLNPLMALGSWATFTLRDRLSDLLQLNSSQSPLGSKILVPMAEAEMLLPCTIGDYTDFYASIFHATNVGKLFRPDNPLLPNYKYIPVGYHGRSSSVVVSGTTIKRPHGQRKKPKVTAPTFGTSQLLDYEVEIGFLIGKGNELGQSISLDRAEDNIFGLCLVNDWSARDIQAWEYRPLGPFLGKSFATTISPWIITLEALAPFRCPALARPETDPAPLPYLDSTLNTRLGGINLTLELLLSSTQMREQQIPPLLLSKSSFQEMYWTIAQMLTHHASNGCNLRPGDLLASGTVSGAEPGSQGSLLEITRKGSQPFELPNREVRSFLEDGDEVILQGYCQQQGCARIGLGNCRGRVIGVAE